MAEAENPGGESGEVPFFQYRLVPLDNPSLENENPRTIPAPPSDPVPKVELTPIQINLDTLYSWNRSEETREPEESVPSSDAIEIQPRSSIQNQLRREGKEPVLILPPPARPLTYHPGLMDRFNQQLRWLFILLFRIVYWILGFPFWVLKIPTKLLIHPLQSLEMLLGFIETRLNATTAILLGLALLAGSGGLLLWLVDSLTWVHLSRWIPAVAAVPVLAWVGMRDSRWSFTRQGFWLGCGCLGATLCWWFTPTFLGHNLWSATHHNSRIQKQLREMTPGLFARFQEGRLDRKNLVQEFPQFLSTIRQEEDNWIQSSMMMETESLEKKKLKLDVIQERLRRLHLNLISLSEAPLVPEQIKPFRQELFQLRLKKSREVAEQMIKKNRFREAYDEAIRPTLVELEEEARQLGVEDDLIQFRAAYETLAKMAELAATQNH